jgi:hypothetical protein
MDESKGEFVYMVVPLTPGVKEGDKDKGTKVAQQVQALINDMSRKSWEFHRVETVYVSIAPGCLAAFSGTKASYVPVNQVIFKKRP